MKLKDKLFTVRDDQPYLTPVGINIPEFEALWRADTSKDKSQYAKELAYIFHTCDFESPYFDMVDKEKEVSKAYMNSEKYKPTKRVEKCIEIYHKMQDSVERRALDSAITLCENINIIANQNQTDTGQFELLLNEIDREIKDCDDVGIKIELMKHKIDLKSKMLGIAKDSTALIPSLEKYIGSINELRVKTMKALYENEFNTKSIGNFLIDDLRNEFRED
jgi:hypothetical protein